MRRLTVKKIIYGVGAAAGTYIVGGTILDAVSNAITQISWRFTIVGSGVLVIVWIFLRLGLNRYPIEWKGVRIKRLGYYNACAFLGVALLIWTPPFLRLFSSSESDPSLALTAKERDENLREQNLQRAIDKLRFNAIDVSVSFRLDVPLDHPPLAAYRARLERCIHLIVSTQRLACGAQNPYPTLYPAEFKHVCVPPGSELYPRPNSESLAYLVLNHPGMLFLFFKPPSRESYAGIKPDLTFSFHQDVSKLKNKNEAVRLCYEISTKTLYLRGNELRMPHSAWKSNEEITSLSDLRQASLIVRPTTYLLVFRGDDKGTGGQLIDESLTAVQIAKTTRLSSITLAFSDGTRWELPVSRFTRVEDDGGARYTMKGPLL